MSKDNYKTSKQKSKNAIILAAGIGKRMLPINQEIPKGLLEVQGEKLIERLIRQLHEAEIQDITIVVGFLSEKYKYLMDKYEINLVYNPYYAVKGSLSSLDLVVGKVSNTYIIPCDIWSKNNPFLEVENHSWYSIGNGRDKESNIRLNSKNQMIYTKEDEIGNSPIGIGYISEADAGEFRENIRAMGKDKDYDDASWEKVLLDGKGNQNILAKILDNNEIVKVYNFNILRNLDKNSNSFQTKIMNLMARETGVEVKDINKIEVLKMGMTNRSFKFSTNGKQYIMRIPGEGTEQLINREKEYNVYKALKGKELGDDIIYISPDSGYKIAKFWETARTCDPSNKKDVKMCIEKLKYLHESRIKVDHTFDLFGRIDYYESLWEGQASQYEDYQEVKANILELQSIIDSIPKVWTLTHIDPVPDNFLFVDGEVHLIDWEYSGMQDAHLDLAMFPIYSIYGKQGLDDFIDMYFEGNCPDNIRVKIYCYVAVAGLLWSNWCEYKRLQGVDFEEYGLAQYNYAKEYYKIAMEGYEKLRECI